MSSSDESDEMPSGFGWADQVASFPPRTASTEEVQQWLEFFLEQRAFDSEEFHIFLNQVRLNGEELHSLSKTKLQKKLPKVPDYGGGFVLEDDLSYYHFEQMLETIFTDIIRARKEVSGGFPPDSLDAADLCSFFMCLIVLRHTYLSLLFYLLFSFPVLFGRKY